MNYEEYKKKADENYKRNEKFIDEFEFWLKDNNLSPKTIRKHVSNAELYINDYLNYSDAETMEEGIFSIDHFLGGWFIEKCLWSSKNSIKETAASIKKFYKCMCEKNYVKKEDYDTLCKVIKDNMDRYLEEMDAYDYDTYFDFF